MDDSEHEMLTEARSDIQITAMDDGDAGQSGVAVHRTFSAHSSSQNSERGPTPRNSSSHLVAGVARAVSKDEFGETAAPAAVHRLECIPSMGGGRAALEKPWEEEHLVLSDGSFRAAVFGFNDGLVSNLGLILGVFFALESESDESEFKIVIAAGTAGLLAGAFSMACGEWLSMTAQKESLEAEIEMEKRHLTDYADDERRELGIYLESLGLKPATIELVHRDLEETPIDNIAAVHAKLEYGISDEDTGAPFKAAAFSFVAFCLGAIIPLMPWLICNSSTQRKSIPFWITVSISIFVSFVVGFFISRTSEISWWWSGTRQILVCCLAIAFTGITNYFLTPLLF